MRSRGSPALLVLLLGCGPGLDAELAEPLVGEWRWVETSGGLTGETRSDPSHRWHLRLDRDGSILEEYEGRPAASGTYRVRAGAPDPPGAGSLTLELMGDDVVLVQDQPFAVRFLGDSLQLSSALYDGFGYRFVRVPGS